MYYDLGYKPEDLLVKVSELMVATADDFDIEIDHCVPEVLRLLREKMKMDVVFVSEFLDGHRVLRQVDIEPQNALFAVGDSTPLEETWCQRVVDGRLPPYIPDVSKNIAATELEKNLPFDVGTFISTPIVLEGGEIYGTLCCLSFKSVESSDLTDLKRLQYTAQLTAVKIDKHRAANKSK